MAGNKIHLGVVSFHEAGVEAVELMQQGDLTRKDLQWLRADARNVLTQAQRLLDEMEVSDDAR